MSANGNSLNGRGMYVWQEITPDIAAEWLALNAVNRNVRRNTVAQYAADMVAGNWREADAPITRRADGMLLDGQHRLSAIIASALTIGAWVHIVGETVTPRDMRLDLGKARSITDIAGIPTQHTSAARTLMLIAGGRGGTATSVDDVISVVERISPQIEALSTTTRRGLSTSGVFAATCYSLHAYPNDAESIIAQYDAMVAGSFGYPFWPAIVSVMRQVMDAAGAGQRARMNAFLRFARAWSPSHRGNQRVVFKDIDGARAAIAPKVAAYIGLNS